MTRGVMWNGGGLPIPSEIPPAMLQNATNGRETARRYPSQELVAPRSHSNGVRLTHKAEFLCVFRPEGALVISHGREPVECGGKPIEPRRGDTLPPQSQTYRSSHSISWRRSSSRNSS